MATSTPQEYGELQLQFTSDFTRAWDDKGSGADHDGSFWTPIPQNDFYILGSLARDNYDDPNGKRWALCVRQTVPGSDALAHPKDWVEVWNDDGAKANKDGSCWAPVPPSDNYVALGHLFVKGYAKPPLSAAVCVRRDLTAPGTIGSAIWDDQGSKAKKDVGVWSIDAPKGTSDATCFLAANSFFAVPNYSRPALNSAANVLALPFVSTSATLPDPPPLEVGSKPNQTSPEYVDHTVLVPFPAIADAARPLEWQILHSPFYQVQRRVQYELVVTLTNRTTETQPLERTYTTGVSVTDTEQFSVTTGITVSYESGVAVGPVSSKVSASLTLELGYQQSRSVSVMETTTTSVTMHVPPGKTSGLWSPIFHIVVLRGDDTELSRMNFKSSVTSFTVQQVPESSEGEPTTSYTTRVVSG